MCFINFLDHESAVLAGEHLVKVGAVLRAMDFIFGIWGSMKTFSHTKRMILFYITMQKYIIQVQKNIINDVNYDVQMDMQKYITIMYSQVSPMHSCATLFWLK